MTIPFPSGHDEGVVAEASTYALAFHQRGMLAEAEKFYAAILDVRPDHFDALRLLGILRQQQGDNAEAMRLISAALRLNPRSFDALSSFAGILYAFERYEEALAAYDQALAITPDHPETLYNRGNVLLHLGRNAEALASFDQALSKQPAHPEMLVNRGNALLALRRTEEALEAFDTVLSIQPDHAIAFGNRRTALKLLARYEEVLESCRKELDLTPDNVASLNDCGGILFVIGRAEEALAIFEKSLAIAPDQPGVLKDRASLLRLLGRHREAVDAYDALLAANPHDADLLYNRGISLWALGKREAAMTSYERAWALGHQRALGDLAMCRLRIADWARAEELVGLICGQIADGELVDPFVPLALGFHPLEQLKAASRHIRNRIPEIPQPFIQSTAIRADTLRIAYLSSDFRQHPVGVAIAELLERHDRTRFEIIGVSFGSNDASSTRARIVKAFDRFHDVLSHSDRNIAGLLSDLGVHIAVALNGLTNGCRLGALAYRAAPIQVSYLGYAGTTGAEFIDYILADETVLPLDQQPFFAEKIVQLPDCYHANDATRRISPQTPKRGELGLPDHGVVFCCFNQTYKIAEPVFEVWMRLLAQVPDSVLWLSEMNEDAYANLRNFAAARGVDPARLIFATWAGAMEDHLARQCAADLFLDTLPYNAHSTTCDALWAGVPVVTCAGTAFPGRVAASMLKAAGLPELVTHSLEDYEALALKLATDRTLLSSIRRKLADNRTTCALFDGDRFRRNVEAAYTTMWDIHRRGESPRSFRVEPRA
jgi:protein O-GlcNAc transferase